MYHTNDKWLVTYRDTDDVHGWLEFDTEDELNRTIPYLIEDGNRDLVVYPANTGKLVSQTW